MNETRHNWLPFLPTTDPILSEPTSPPLSPTPSLTPHHSHFSSCRSLLSQENEVPSNAPIVDSSPLLAPTPNPGSARTSTKCWMTVNQGNNASRQINWERDSYFSVSHAFGQQFPLYATPPGCSFRLECNPPLQFEPVKHGPRTASCYQTALKKIAATSSRAYTA